MEILIVEDDSGIGDLMAEILTPEVEKITVVTHGSQAMEYIKTHPSILIILDYSLPDMNASELIQQLLDRDIEVPPFIISTGQGDEHIAVEMMKMGALDYLVKDITLLEKLPDVVRRAIKELEKEKKLKKALQAQRASEERLLEEQRRLANIISATNIGTWELDFPTRQMRINQRYATILGYTPQELSPCDFDTLRSRVHPDDQSRMDEAFQNHLQKKSDYYQVDVRVKTRQQKWIWVMAQGCIMEYQPDGQPLLMSGILQDVTDKKEKDQLQKEVDIAHKTLMFKQNFLASMSHEMRTPLTGILGITELLSKTNLDNTQTEYVYTLQNASQNLKEIIDQVLDYSKIEAGKIRLHPRVFEVKMLVSQAKGLFESICRKPIEFKSYIDPTLPENLLADHQRVTQVIQNLLVNAIKFTYKGVVSFGLQKVSDTEKSQIVVQAEVSDTGIGIQPEMQDVIFSPFSQVHKIDTADYEGAGLGLSISKELVAMLGGQIRLQSTPGEGSTFRFTFKAAIPASKLPPEESAIEAPIDPMHILLVEDKSVTRKIISLQLADMGHQVAFAIHGQEALEKSSHHRFDLILMDIQMPVMDGITATQKLKKQYAPHKLPPIVGLSANAFEGDREKYMSMGFDEYLTKPMQIEDFNKVIRKLKTIRPC